MRVTKDMIDPSLRLPGRIVDRLMGGTQTVISLRKGDPTALKLLKYLPARGIRRYEVTATRPDGTDLRLIVMAPLTPVPDAPALLWIHGGGYAFGSPDGEAVSVRPMIDATGAVVVSPDYRRSSQAPYPAALDDCYTALVWLRDNAVRLGAADDRIVVGGVSAGGGLTAALSLLARDRGEVNIAFQCPIYPMIDDRPTPSSTDNTAPVWNSVTNCNAWRLYLGELEGGDVPAYAAPARATDLSGLPPTITFVGSIEAFHDETSAYVDALNAAGVPTEFRVVPGAWHGFDAAAPWTRPAKEAKAWFLDRFVEYTARYRAPQPGSAV
ncbi:alpha/beta hydrolase [Rhodococcus sp. NBC_00297]|uniref:alpha/beta hydrolase n=1 Tax=Rhodococcus sp. NBC_00297 TaxID=2976005 RepID=UPI002E2C83E2|nr:alpha/beta hydrolase [Rhodococcus sp. NBC_00297]